MGRLACGTIARPEGNNSLSIAPRVCESGTDDFLPALLGLASQPSRELATTSDGYSTEPTILVDAPPLPMIYRTRPSLIVRINYLTFGNSTRCPRVFRWERDGVSMGLSDYGMRPDFRLDDGI